MLSLLSLFFLTGCKEDDDLEVIKKSYIYHDFTRKGNSETYKYRVVYPFTIRIKADGKIVTEEKFEQYFNDINEQTNDRRVFFIGVASSGMDLDAEIEILGARGNPPSLIQVHGFYDVRVIDTFFPECDRCEGDNYWPYPMPGETYKNSYCRAYIKTKNLMTVRLDKVKPEDLQYKDRVRTRQFLARYSFYPYEVYEQTPEGEKQIYVDRQTEENWCSDLWFTIYSFGKDVTPDYWPLNLHFAHYY